MSAVPTTRKGLETRERILTASRKVVGRDGFVAFRMQDVAQEAEVSQGALYRYFENKNDLFLSLIGDIHAALYEASRATHSNFRDEPFATLRESNYGYLYHYRANADIMRAFIEATMVNQRLWEMWWWMRKRHIGRFVTALKRDFSISEVDGVPIQYIADSLVSASEQSAFVWYAQPVRYEDPIPTETASLILAQLWFNAIWNRHDGLEHGEPR